jgi:hypothetical protein
MSALVRDGDTGSVDFADRLGAIDRQTSAYRDAIAEATAHRSNASQQITQVLRQTVDYFTQRNVKPLPLIIAPVSGDNGTFCTNATQCAWAASGISFALTDDARLIPAVLRQLPPSLENVSDEIYRKTGLQPGDFYVLTMSDTRFLATNPTEIIPIPGTAVGPYGSLLIKPPFELQKQHGYGVRQDGSAIAIHYYKWGAMIETCG